MQQVTAQVQAAVAASAGLQAVPANLSPPLAHAPADKPGVFSNGCVRSWLDVGQPMCVSGDPSSTTTVALVGDSHAAMWNPALESLAEQRRIEASETIPFEAYRQLYLAPLRLNE